MGKSLFLWEIGRWCRYFEKYILHYKL